MSQLEEIRTAQNTLEECFSKRMAELEAQLHTGGPAKDTVAKVAEEFRTFRELMYSMLGMLRKQIIECSRMVDVIETRHRRKALIFLGVTEEEKEDCKATVVSIFRKMQLTDITASSIRVCHRIGAASKNHQRPILVRFVDIDSRTSVWRSKSKLKGSSIAVKEFLTKTRQAVHAKARQHFGMRDCWTQDGVIVVKAADGSRHKITSLDELNSLKQKYPKSAAESLVEGKTAVVGSTNSLSKLRK